ncbi:retrograde regulation protein 2 [Mucor velutinosus]|uniref:Retrograde regulation protein 2 n=1 Tax=Mucor velutinosus TaxID=708070 RepID=A0AAN7I3C2_9FUNG|nr:retrograde regulation protein 2 [Mucor velutinosus]
MSSKYSTLPDIDDQPDVYETPDSTDNVTNVSYENQSSDEDDNENVVKSRVSVKDAANRFKGSIVDSTDTDFSDRLTRRKKAMYRTYVKRPPAMETNEYEILPKNLSLDETPLQKLRRLMYEVQELNDEMEKAKEPADAKETISQSDILSQIAYLQSDLVRMNQQIGDDGLSQKSNYGKSIEDAKSLIKQLEAFKNIPATTASDKKEESDTAVSEKSDKNDMVTYELFYTPETAKMQKESKLSDIDERIAKIEKLVGSNAGQALDELPQNLASTSLVNSLSKLEQQVLVLAQPRQLEMVARRVKVLNSDLDRLNELKSSRKDTSSLGFGLSSAINPQNTPSANEAANKDSNDNEAKINKLFATLEKVDPLLNLTPALLTRLKALQTLHTEAASFGKSVKVISEEQTRMTDELKSLTTTCDLLNQSLKENDESINNNIKVIDDRMTDLIQRMTALSNTDA